jgi:phosphopantetheinyl transferase
MYRISGALTAAILILVFMSTICQSDEQQLSSQNINKPKILKSDYLDLNISYFKFLILILGYF